MQQAHVFAVEWRCQALAHVACSEHGDSARFLLCLDQCRFHSDLHTRSSWARSDLGILQLRCWAVDVSCIISRSSCARSLTRTRYSTMDNIDGKQARRTGTSSGLGELFDHGIDSLNCTLASLCETAAMGLGPSKTGAFTALVPCLPMFFSTWETYHTHTLYLGAFNGPTEGLILACSVMMISGYLGPQIWSYRVADYVSLPINLPVDIPSDLTFRDLWIPIILVAFFTAHLPACVYHVAQARYRADLPLMPVFLEWTPMILFTGCCMAWLASPHSILLAENYLLIFCLTMSFVFGRLTTKIILHHLTRRSFPYWTSSMAPLVGGAVMAWLPLFGYEQVSPNFERWYIYGYLIYAMALYFTWAVRAINRICAVLDINCLTIKKRKADSREAEAFRGELKTTSNGDVRQTKKEL